MFQQPLDFKDESKALYALVEGQPDEALTQPTQFKGWSSNDVIGHLHMWNWAADLSLRDGDAFMAFFAEVASAMEGKGLRDFERNWLDGLAGRDLLETWRAFYIEAADRFAAADPKLRVKWAGPDMSVRSSITARLMETWAHGQAVYDMMGVMREDKDRIKNIAILGMNTFSWTFINRKLGVPEPVPYVRLTAPSGAIWEWNDAGCDNRVEGQATEFCQVVTQTRNIADTRLQISGDIARQWMAIAQCFAGPPQTPPMPGVRKPISMRQSLS